MVQVVQKLFEKCALPTCMAMLEHVSCHLVIICIHKNGTWAAQKIIECVQTPEETNLIAQHLWAYALITQTLSVCVEKGLESAQVQRLM